MLVRVSRVSAWGVSKNLSVFISRLFEFLLTTAQTDTRSNLTRYNSGGSLLLHVRILLVIERQLQLVFVLRLFDNALVFALLPVTAQTAALLLQPSASVLVLTHLASALDGVCHHLLLLEAFADVVAVQFEVALLAEAQQDLRAEAAPYHVRHR